MIAPGTPAPGFDDPIGLLEACHGRIERHCNILCRLAEHLAAHGADDDTRAAADQVLRYFSTAARHHHEDEEQDLFPALRAAGAEVADALAALQAQHLEMDNQWTALEPLLQDPARIRDPAVFLAQARAFQKLHAKHIAVENETVLPLARERLDAEACRRIGRAMAHRRGVVMPE